MEEVKKYLDYAFTQPHIRTILTMFLVLYGGFAAPKLPKSILGLFENPIFKILILSIVVYTGQKDPKFSILIAVVFLISITHLHKLEGFADANIPYNQFNNLGSYEHREKYDTKAKKGFPYIPYDPNYEIGNEKIYKKKYVPCKE